MESFTLVPLAVFLGLILGSFMNVVIHRWPLGQSVVRPRSSCPACNSLIAWYDNVPLVSYALLKGKCRQCKAPISGRYPLVEFLSALLLVTATLTHPDLGWVLLIRDWPLLLAMVAIIFIDLDHRLIPDELSLGGLVLALVTAGADSQLGWGLSFLGGALGFGFFYLTAWIYDRLTGRTGLGGGDIKLLAMLGAFLGPQGVLTVVLVSSIAGSLYGIGQAWTQRDPEVGKVAIPYGPFLVIGALTHYLLGNWLWLQFTNPT